MLLLFPWLSWLLKAWRGGHWQLASLIGLLVMLVRGSFSSQLSREIQKIRGVTLALPLLTFAGFVVDRASQRWRVVVRAEAQ